MEAKVNESVIKTLDDNHIFHVRTGMGGTKEGIRYRWKIGSDCTLRGGITINTGAVVASNSVVLEDVSPYAIVAGVPAKVKKFRFAPEIITALLDSKWWEYELGDMYREGLDFSSPSKFLEKLAVVKDRLRKYNPTPFEPYKVFMDNTKKITEIEVDDGYSNEDSLLNRYKLYEEYFRDYVAKDKEKSLKNFFQINNIHHVAIYGLTEISRGLIPLIERLGVYVEYAVEEYHINEINKVISRNSEEFPVVDCMIICDLRVSTIKQKLKGKELPFPIFDMYEILGEKAKHDENNLY